MRPSLPGASSVVVIGDSSSISPSHSSTRVPTRVAAASGGAEEAKLGRLADDEAELLAGHVGLGAFLHAEGHDAQRLDRRRAAGHGGQRGLDADVVGPGRAAADADALAAPHQAVVGGPGGHGAIEIGARQLAHAAF